MMQRIVILWTVLILYAAQVVAFPDSIGIAAVVDDQVISTVDLSERIALVIGTTGIPDTAETRARITSQVLRQLVDEKLQMEEAARSSITISDIEVRGGIARIEQQSNKPPGSLEQFLDSKGLSKPSFYAQVRAQLAWSQIVLKKVRPKVRISDQEIKSEIKRKENKANDAAKIPEVQIATIQLPVDSPTNEINVKKLADKLTGEIRSGANFEAVATQFSSGTHDTKATVPFWVELSQLDPIISTAIGKTAKGAITDPVRTANGYQIIKLIDMREAVKEAAKANSEASARTELAYKEILMTLKPDAERKEAELLLQMSKEVAKAPGKCEEKSMAGAGDLAALDFKVTLSRNVSENIPEKLRDIITKLKVGAVSDPIITPQGIHLFMLCERIDLPPSKALMEAQDDAIRQSIYQEKLELEAQKYLRNLRREAFIEIRTH
jgi:peptidyl-prolyl cis-trans isomerase SurA